MSGYELFKELSELDADLIIAPKKLVSLRMNFLLCIIAANISKFVPRSHMVLSVVVFILSFAILYCIAYWWVNRKRKNKMLIEDVDET